MSHRTVPTNCLLSVYLSWIRFQIKSEATRTGSYFVSSWCNKKIKTTVNAPCLPQTNTHTHTHTHTHTQIRRQVLVFPKVKPKGCLDLSVLQFDPRVCVCARARVWDSRYLSLTLIELFRNPPTTASTHKHRLETVLQAVALPLTRCSRLQCQMNHLQNAGVSIRREGGRHSCCCSVKAERNPLLGEDAPEIRPHLLGCTW